MTNTDPETMSTSELLQVFVVGRGPGVNITDFSIDCSTYSRRVKASYKGSKRGKEWIISVGQQLLADGFAVELDNADNDPYSGGSGVDDAMPYVPPTDNEG